MDKVAARASDGHKLGPLRCPSTDRAQRSWDISEVQSTKYWHKGSTETLARNEQDVSSLVGFHKNKVAGRTYAKIDLFYGSRTD